MCGYIEINGEHPDPITQNPDFSEFLPFIKPNHTKVFYPAFGKDGSRTLDIVFRDQQGTLQKVAATWWFDCVENEHQLIPSARTTFNARNLDSPFWKSALKYQRAIVFATGIGESKLVGKTKHQYLMQSDNVFALAALYRRYENGQFSCAVITRDAHPKMTPYHDKAFPCFLPMNVDFLNLWLDPTIHSHPEIEHMLAYPVLHPTLYVQRVKTYKNKEIMKTPPPALLLSDLA